MGNSPVVFRSKVPADDWNGPRNVALVLGAASGHLADVDLDSPEAVALASQFLPATSAFGRNGAVRHLLYVADGAPSRRWNDEQRKAIVELRANSSTGGRVLTMAPPSIHPSGEAVVWMGAAEPVRIDAAELQERVASLAAKALETRGK